MGTSDPPPWVKGYRKDKLLAQTHSGGQVASGLGVQAGVQLGGASFPWPAGCGVGTRGGVPHHTPHWGAGTASFPVICSDLGRPLLDGEGKPGRSTLGNLGLASGCLGGVV